MTPEQRFEEAKADTKRHMNKIHAPDKLWAEACSKIQIEAEAFRAMVAAFSMTRSDLSAVKFSWEE